MYRKPLLTSEDARPLIGRVVRFEFSNYEHDHVRWVGVPYEIGQYDWESDNPDSAIYFRRADGTTDEILFIQGANVVFATTVDDMREDEAAFVPVRWVLRHTLS